MKLGINKNLKPVAPERWPQPAARERDLPGMQRFFITLIMVNVDLLKAHAGKYKMTRDNAAEIYRQLFTLHKETAPYFDAEDIDPDHILKSNKFLMGGQMLLPVFFRLPQVAADDRQWRRVLSEFKEQFEDSSFPMSEFNKLKDPFFETMKLHAGGLTPEQKKEWGALLDKAYTDMKSFGWY